MNILIRRNKGLNISNGNQTPLVEEGQTTQWLNETGQNDKKTIHETLTYIVRLLEIQVTLLTKRIIRNV